VRRSDYTQILVTACSMGYCGGGFAHASHYENSPPINEFPKWTCAYCKGVNRWMSGDKPPEKCRSCGAPERA
jgi:rubrerythrin